MELKHECRLVEPNSEGDTIVLGDEIGRFYSINGQFLLRIIEEGGVGINSDKRISVMRERLRRLRD